MTLPRILALLLVVAVAIASTVTLAGKKEDDQIQALEDRIATLEASLADMEAKVDEKIQTAIQEIANRDQFAMEAYRSIIELASAGKQLEAKEQMTEFMSKYQGTEAARRAARLNQELAVVGKPAPAQFNVSKWFQGEDQAVDLAADGTTLLVFWEEWCPHCKREVPKLEQTYEKFKADGLNVFGVTKVTKSSTDEKVATFIEANQVSYPIAKETGDVSRYFNVSGIPAAAVVKDGQIVWRGHPNRLTEAMIAEWLGAS